MTSTSTLLFLKVLCDIERKENETISNASQEENVTASDNSTIYSQTPLKIYMQEKHGIGGSLGSKRYACHKCSCLFRRKRHLRRHLKTYCSHKCLGCSECAAEINECYHKLLGEAKNSLRSFPCPSCASTFHTQAGLAIHEEFHPQPGKLLRCDSCPKQFASRWDLDHHQKMHITSEVFKCRSCTKAFTTPSSLAKHRQSRHEKRDEDFGEHFLASLSAAASEEHDMSLKFACELCEVVCSDDNELYNHISRHFSDGKIRCLECSKLFQTEQELSKHMRVHRLPGRKKVPREKQSGAPWKNTETTSHEEYTQCVACSNGDRCEAHQDEHLDEDVKTCNLCLQKFRFVFYKCIHVCKNFPPVEDLNEKTLEENNFQCPACSKQFTSILPLKLHCFVHRGGHPQHCNICDKRFSAVTKLDYHLEVHARNTCMKCGIFFNTRLALLLHDCGAPHRPFKCMECGDEFPSKYSFKKHWSIHPGQKEPQYQCSECSHMFLKESNFRAHRIVHTGTYPFSCTLCDDKFLTYGSFKTHSIAHINGKIIQCEECDKVFDTQQKFTSHMKSHRKETENAGIKADEEKKLTKARPKYGPLTAHKCHLCEMVFRSETHLRTHRIQVHNEKVSYPQTCKFCARGFFFKSNMEKHMKICCQRSEEERKNNVEEVCRKRAGAGAGAGKKKPKRGPFPCSVCGKVYTTESGRDRHMFVHRDVSEYPHQCSLCGLGFVKEYYKIYHEAKCKGDVQVLKCKICGAFFKNLSTYNKHQKCHLREHSCNVCGEKFLTNQGFKRHVAVCTPESFNDRLSRQEKKPTTYSCTACMRTFSLRNRFLVHLESHEGKAPFECKICQKKFLSKSNLTRHKCKVGSDPDVKMEVGLLISNEDLKVESQF